MWPISYWFHYPEALAVVLVALELFVKYDVFAGQLIGRGKEVVLVGLLVVLLVESPLVLLEVLVEHVLATELIPASEVVDTHAWQNAVPLEHPIHLLLLAPHHVPVVVVSLFPLTPHETFVHAVFETGLELYAASMSRMQYGCTG